MPNLFFPPEWYPQSGVQITWPHSGTDWSDILKEVTQCYVLFSKEILKQEKLLVVCNDKHEITKHFTTDEQQNLIIVEVDSNDTWARDHGAISVFKNDQPIILDFGFNAWGLKFSANKDNLITGQLFNNSVFNTEVSYHNHNNFILEGGSIESDGKGTILTTTACLLAPNRNQPMSKSDIELYLKSSLGAERILWLNHGYLAGDDTDNHIDTLARFCNETTIAYIKCDDQQDEHYEELKAMEEELMSFKAYNGQPYNLIPLPMADAVYDGDYRLPATYANFLIINNVVLLPFYDSPKDNLAKQQLQKAFPNREIIGINSNSLIKQHGSLHCVTMQFPEGFL